MYSCESKTSRRVHGLAAIILLLGADAALAQSVNLTVDPAITKLPDGQSVPMWSYHCTDGSGSNAATGGNPTCAATNAAVSGSGWSPVLITVPYTGAGTSLTINLSNNLVFTGASIPTSLVIVGQVGGGLGQGGTATASPVHPGNNVTWPTAKLSISTITVTNAGKGYSKASPPTVSFNGTGGAAGTAIVSDAGEVTAITVTNAGSNYPTPPGVTITDVGGTGTGATAIARMTVVSTNGSKPPAQLPRVQSFGTEVAADGKPVALTWSNLQPGTYLLESGTHPSIQVPMGLYGILVVTTQGVGTSGQGYPADATSPGTAATRAASTYDADLALALGEIDPVQNIAVNAAVSTPGFSETTVWSAAPNGCAANDAAPTCYPPTVNYSPRYYLINGVAFDRTNLSGATASLLTPAVKGAAVTATTGNVLVRLVNAGSRMHVPSIVNMPMSVIAEDGNPLPGLPRLQNETFLAAGKTNDVIVKPVQVNSAYTAATYAVFDRQLSLSTNNQRDGGMQSYIAIAGGASTGAGTTAGSGTHLVGAVAKTYFCVIGQTLNVADPTLGLLGGSSGANGVAVNSTALPGVLTVQSNGTFTYASPASGKCGGNFTYTINGTKALTGTLAQCDATFQDEGCTLGKGPVLADDSFTGSNAQVLNVNPPGILLNDSDPNGLPLKVDAATVPAAATVGLTSLIVNADGSFSAVAPAFGIYKFTYNVKNSQQVASGTPATVTLNFPKGSGLTVNLQDKNVPGRKITDYRWIIEEDRTFWIDPKCQVNTGRGTRPNDSYGRPCPPIPVESLGYNFHSAGMPVVATGCVGTMSCESGQTVLGQPAVCDVGDGICRTTDANGATLNSANAYRTPLDPSQVALDPNKHYFLSVMPGDGINPTLQAVGGPVTDPVTKKIRQFDPAIDCPSDSDYVPGKGACGHNMGGAQIGPQFNAQHGSIVPSVTISLAQTPLPTAKIAVLVYQDDYPLNGENDAGGGVDILAPNEAGLGGFQIELLDQAGGLGDNTGQVTYDMFNMPVSNSLANTMDPMTKLNACPLSSNPDGLVGMVITCPTFESDGKTMSPLAGQAVIANLYPGLYEVQAFPAADRIGRGEEWLQTNTLDGGKPHEAFIRPGEPSYFQEFGPGGFHVQIGFANPKIINDRLTNLAHTGICDPLPTGGGLACTSTLNGHVHGNHMSRTPDERTYDTGSYKPFQFSNCYVSLGIPDQQDFAFAKCDPNGNFTMTGLPAGTYKVAVFDQWNDIMLDGLITAVTLAGGTQDVTFTATQWRTNLYTRIYLDTNNNGIPDRDGQGNDLEGGLALVPINIRYRDGSKGFANNTDLNGYATYNEVFPFMNWLVVEPDQTRFKPTGQHVVYDSGGPDDCSPNAIKAYGGNGHCTGSNTSAFLAGTVENNSLPLALRVPGAVYCVDADCTAQGESLLNGAYWKGTDTSPTAGATTGLSSGRIDPPWKTEAWQGLLGQHSFIDFGMKPFATGENGGIQGLVVYASTRPFDDPSLDVQLVWEPAVPNVKINLYKETTSADSGTPSLVLVDSTYTSSWDAWAQGFRTGSDGKTLITVPGTNKDGSTGYVPNMSCPGQDSSSGFFATLQGSKMWLDTADASGNKKALAYNSQFKCFDGWSMLNQIQPAPYDGKYQFPSIVAVHPVTGKPTGTGALNGATTTQLNGTNCSICVANPDDGTPMLPPGKYVVEVVTPAGFEIVKEEDKNILMGDIYIAPVTQQFAGVGNVYILPDQAAMNAYYNANNPLNSTSNLGVTNPRDDFASNNQMWPCAGQIRIVPDAMSLFPQVGQTAPFAGASRPLCDRREVILSDQMTASTKFFIYTKNHIAGHFVGGMTNDMASEFDPFSPQFGEKFGVPNLPIRMRDFVGDEVTRVYGDQWGAYNGMYFSSWEVNPPNPTGYAPQMSVACMNDPGPIPDPSGAQNADGTPVMITDPAYNPAYSNYCYETPFMPGFTAYMDTPVVPVQAFADHYNLPDAEYPDGTPVIKRADFKAAKFGPWSAGSAGVGAVTINNAGTNYTSVPTVKLTGGGGSGALATVAMSVGSVALGTVTSSFTTPPAVSFTGASGSGAQATACIGVSQVSVTSGGSNYRNGPLPPLVFFIGGGANFFNMAHASAKVVGGKITAITIENPGCGYSSAPTVVIFGMGGFGAVATASVNLTGVNVTNGGTGYTSAPTVNFSSGTATATALLNVNAVNVTAGGQNYTSAPAVAFSGGGGTGASATAALGGVSAASDLVLTAFGDRPVQNPQFAGPSANTAPFNAKTVVRHYGFGPQCTALSTTCAAISSVTIGGFPATIQSWSPLGDSITVTVPSGLAPCPVQQRDASKQVCGEVVVTAGNGKQTIDGVTVTVGGNTPTYVNASSPTSNAWGEFYPNPLQYAIDTAKPGDLIMVDAGSYRENLIMWKPVRLQGVGNGVVTINADAHPAGKMDAWRRRVSCLFGLNIQGTPNPSNGAYDPSGQYNCPADQYFRADRIPFEGFVGWDASSNGNLAQVLQEPSLMGAYEGAGVTVVGRGVNQSGSNNSDLWGQVGGAGTFANGSVYTSLADCRDRKAPASNVDDYATSNFLCNPSSIDGFSIINSSQGGGGIFLHGWSHNMQIANNRISANAGTLSGAINLGNGEAPPAFLNDNTICGNGIASPAPLCPPIPRGTGANAQIPFQFNANVHIHHNQVLNNASVGDALFSGSPAGAGGVTISAGSDNYELDHNWIAANLTSSDGGGVAHMGVSFNGKIHNNFVLFNQANNPTLPVDGGGIVIMGAQEDRTLPNGQECGGVTDLDCPPGIGDGTGPGLVIDSNLILGNSAEDGSGGGLRLRQTNGSEVASFLQNPDRWYGITVTNNIIANNVAGWDGGGVSLQDSFKTVFVNNTVASNDTTASAGVLFKTLGAINAASPPPGCLPTPDPSQPQNPNCLLSNGPHIPQPAGLVTMQNTPNMMSQLPNGVVCPAGFGYGDANDSIASRTNGRCVLVSLPQISNDLFWQNRAFHVEIVDQNGDPITGTTTDPSGTGLYSHQNIVALLPLFKQSYTGQCVAPPANQDLYWDLGVRMDLLNDQNGHTLVFDASTVGAGSYTTGAGGSGVTANLNDAGPIGLTASNSILSDQKNLLNIVGTQNSAPAKTPVQGQYCNGARIPPEQCDAGQGANNPAMCKGYFSPAGQSESVGVAPVFTFNGIAATATVDEGNNWINMTYGPLTLSRPPAIQAGSTASAEPTVASAAVGISQGAYSIGSDSDAVGGGNAQANGVPGKDFYGQTRPKTSVSIGAVELIPGAPTLATISPASGAASTNVTVTLTGTGFTTGSTIAISGGGVTASDVTRISATQLTATFTIATSAVQGDRAVSVSSSGGTSGNVTFTVAAPPPPPSLGSLGPSSGARGLSVSVTLTGANLTGATGVTVARQGGGGGGGGFNNGVTVTNIAVDSTGTHLTATFTIDPAATIAARNVSVTSARGNSGTVTFNVIAAPPPTLASISPNSGNRGSPSFTVTFTGTNLVGGTVNVDRPGGGRNRVNVSPNATVNAAGTVLTATFTIAGNAAQGVRNVNVTTGGGTTATKLFTVN